MNFKIYRGNWRRGGANPDTANGKGITCLLNPQGYMCCLGHASHDLGFKPADLLEMEGPQTLYSELSRQPKSDQNLFDRLRLAMHEGRDWNLSDVAIGINDDTRVDEETREARLIKAFKRAGHNLEFVDGIRPGIEVKA